MARTAEPISAAMLEFLVWVDFRPRTHADAMEAWQSHCPRFTLWEDALDQELIELVPCDPGANSVRLTQSGRAIVSKK